MNHTPSQRYLAVFIALAVSAFSARAQTVPAPPAQPSERDTSSRDQTITLSPFTVSTEKDTGYMAADVMSGGQLATNLLKTATDVTVLTRDFLDDIGAVDMQHAQIWLNGSDPASDTVNGTDPRDFGQGASFRGLQSSNNTRDFFRQDFTPPNYVVDRIEGSRGPNGIIYGDATSGGKTNFVTKRAKFYNFGSFKLILDSFGDPLGRAVNVDLNRVITDKWAVRVNVQDKKSAQWYDRSVDDATGVQFATTYRPWKGGELRFEAEKDLISRTNFRPDFTDNLSNWDRTTVVSAPLTASPAASTGLSRLANDTYVYISGLGVMNWKNFAQTSGTGLSLYTDLGEGRDSVPRFPVIPSRKFNPNSPNEVLDQHQQNDDLVLEQRFGDLTIEAAGDFADNVRIGDTTFMANSFIDVNKVLPTGQPNPNFGKIYSTTAGWVPVRTASYATAARLAAAYKLPFKSFTQTISAVGSYRERLDAFKAYQLYRDNGAISPGGLTGAALDGNQNVKIWRYWDDPDADTAIPNNTTANQYHMVNSRDQHNRSQLKSAQINTVGSYFRDTLTLVAGIRTDRFHATTRDTTRRDVASGQPTDGGGIWVDANATTSQIGVTYFPIKPIGLYGYKSGGFNPSVINTRKLDDSSPYDLSIARSKGAGLRFNLLNSRIVGSVGYYDSYEKDRYTQQNLTQINNVWDALTAAGNKDAVNKRIPQLGGLAQYTDATTIRAWGWEGELTANVSKNFRLIFNGDLPHTKQSNSLPDTKAYYAANIALWSQYRSTTAVDNAIKTLENQISSFTDGRPLNGLYRYRANVFANYTFHDVEWLKNVRVGLGANVFGQQIIGNVTNQPRNFIYNDAYYLATGTLGYSRKIYGYLVDFNLSASNLLNYDEPIYRNGGVATATVNGVARQFRSGYYWPTPRFVQLTTTVKF